MSSSLPPSSHPDSSAKQPSIDRSDSTKVGSESTPALLLTDLSTDSLPANVDRERLKVLAGIVADIDHTMLKQTTTQADLSVLCAEANLARNLLG